MKSNPALKCDLKKLLLEEIKNTTWDVDLYLSISQESSPTDIDHEWLHSAREYNSKQRYKLEFDLKSYLDNMINESIRVFSYFCFVDQLCRWDIMIWLDSFMNVAI